MESFAEVGPQCMTSFKGVQSAVEDFDGRLEALFVMFWKVDEASRRGVEGASPALAALLTKRSR
jgi:hypothetical protein